MLSRRVHSGCKGSTKVTKDPKLSRRVHGGRKGHILSPEVPKDQQWSQMVQKGHKRYLIVLPNELMPCIVLVKHVLGEVKTPIKQIRTPNAFGIELPLVTEKLLLGCCPENRSFCMGCCKTILVSP